MPTFLSSGHIFVYIFYKILNICKSPALLILNIEVVQSGRGLQISIFLGSLKCLHNFMLFQLITVVFQDTNFSLNSFISIFIIKEKMNTHHAKISKIMLRNEDASNLASRHRQKVRLLNNLRVTRVPCLHGIYHIFQILLWKMPCKKSCHANSIFHQGVFFQCCKL